MLQKLTNTLIINLTERISDTESVDGSPLIVEIGVVGGRDLPAHLVADSELESGGADECSRREKQKDGGHGVCRSLHCFVREKWKWRSLEKWWAVLGFKEARGGGWEVGSYASWRDSRGKSRRFVPIYRILLNKWPNSKRNSCLF